LVFVFSKESFGSFCPCLLQRYSVRHLTGKTTLVKLSLCTWLSTPHHHRFLSRFRDVTSLLPYHHCVHPLPRLARHPHPQLFNSQFKSSRRNSATWPQLHFIGFISGMCSPLHILGMPGMIFLGRYPRLFSMSTVRSIPIRILSVSLVSG
jgi:hypothetical protein